jgi:phosphorylcholine metabolism protein LicD
MDLLKQNSSDTSCRASILHMLLVEVYEELEALGKSPIVMFGSLLGAVRDKGMIPFTEDADIGYRGRIQVGDNLQRLLWQKGYHLFLMKIWRVCVAPTHPLAAKLYDPSVPINTKFAIPYLDLYNMEQRRRTGEWKIEEMNKINGSRLISDGKVRPFSKVTINGQQFASVNDPEYLLERMYGQDFMTPKPRKRSIQQLLDLRVGS